MDFSVIGDHPATKILILCDAQANGHPNVAKDKVKQDQKVQKKTQKIDLWFSNVF